MFVPKPPPKPPWRQKIEGLWVTARSVPRTRLLIAGGLAVGLVVVAAAAAFYLLSPSLDAAQTGEQYISKNLGDMATVLAEVTPVSGGQKPALRTRFLAGFESGDVTYGCLLDEVSAASDELVTVYCVMVADVRRPDIRLDVPIQLTLEHSDSLLGSGLRVIDAAVLEDQVVVELDESR